MSSRPTNVPTPSPLANAIAQGWFDFGVKLPVGRPWVTVREAAIALGRLNADGVTNDKWIIDLVDAGELCALNGQHAGRIENSRRISALSVRLYVARNSSLDATAMRAQLLQLIRDVAEELPLDAVEQVLHEVKRVKAERIETRRCAK